MEHLEHYRSHMMDIDKNEVGYERKALPYEECYPPLHLTTWLDRDSFKVRIAWDGAKSSRAVQESVATTDPESETSRSSMSSTHLGRLTFQGHIPDHNDDEVK